MKETTYGSFICDYKPHKTEKEQTRLTAGGDRINYPEDCSTPTADMIQQYHWDYGCFHDNSF
jgi:hypothetical protein